jgi:SAM-dependent methyltransferase
MSQRSENMLAVRDSSHEARRLEPEPDVNGGREAKTNLSEHSQELCLICGQKGAKDRLQAPDRLHGRQKNYVLLHCPSCSLVWQGSPPQPDEMHLHYTDAYHKLISTGGDSLDRWRDRKATIELHKRSGALLDLGCSSGAFLGVMKGPAWRLSGVEMSSECARRAKVKTGAHVFVGDILDAHFPPESFDVITCFDVLEHVYEPFRVMIKVREWLKPGGVFYVQVPNIDSAESRVFGTYWHGLELPRHISHFSPASLRNLGRSAGLEEALLVTQRNSAVGISLRYMWDDFFRAIGIRRTPVVYRNAASLPWRAARKLTRITVLRLLLMLAPLAGGGEAIQAIFRKKADLPLEDS